jgi:Ca2+-binding EF-hand superfamily protein
MIVKSVQTLPLAQVASCCLSLVTCFNTQLTDSRSTIIREVCATLQVFAQTLAQLFEPFSPVVHSLVSLLRGNKRALTIHPNDCLRAIIKYCTTTPVLQSLVESLLSFSSKSGSVEVDVCELLAFATSHWPVEALLPLQIQLQHLLVTLLVHASSDVRKVARVWFSSFWRVWPAAAQSVYQSLPNLKIKHAIRKQVTDFRPLNDSDCEITEAKESNAKAKSLQTLLHVDQVISKEPSASSEIISLPLSEAGPVHITTAAFASPAKPAPSSGRENILPPSGYCGEGESTQPMRASRGQRSRAFNTNLHKANLPNKLNFRESSLETRRFRASQHGRHSPSFDLVLAGSRKVPISADLSFDPEVSADPAQGVRPAELPREDGAISKASSTGTRTVEDSLFTSALLTLDAGRLEAEERATRAFVKASQTLDVAERQALASSMPDEQVAAQVQNADSHASEGSGELDQSEVRTSEIHLAPADPEAGAAVLVGSAPGSKQGELRPAQFPSDHPPGFGSASRVAHYALPLNRPEGKGSDGPRNLASLFGREKPVTDLDVNTRQLRSKLRAAAYTMGGPSWEKLFRVRDADMSNTDTLNEAEFRTLLRKHGKLTEKMFSDEEVSKIFQVIDTNANQFIELNEFVSWINDDSRSSTPQRPRETALLTSGTPGKSKAKSQASPSGKKSITGTFPANTHTAESQKEVPGKAAPRSGSSRRQSTSVDAFPVVAHRSPRGVSPPHTTPPSFESSPAPARKFSEKFGRARGDQVLIVKHALDEKTGKALGLRANFAGPPRSSSVSTSDATGMHSKPKLGGEEHPALHIRAPILVSKANEIPSPTLPYEGTDSNAGFGQDGQVSGDNEDNTEELLRTEDTATVPESWRNAVRFESGKLGSALGKQPVQAWGEEGEAPALERKNISTK